MIHVYLGFYISLNCYYRLISKSIFYLQIVIDYDNIRTTRTLFSREIFQDRVSRQIFCKIS